MAKHRKRRRNPKDVWEFASEHPFITFFIVSSIGGAVASTARALMGCKPLFPVPTPEPKPTPLPPPGVQGIYGWRRGMGAPSAFGAAAMRCMR